MPAEVPVGAVVPDGVVRIAVGAAGVDGLSAPWSRLRREATIEVKMRGDHVDAAALARAELRRLARWVQHLERMRPSALDVSAPVVVARDEPDPREFALWVVGSHLPQWLRRYAARGLLAVECVAPGCWRIGPRDHEVLWIAANELPLRLDLLPLLVARSGGAFVAFLKWAAVAVGFAWVARVIQELPMDPDLADEFKKIIPEDDESQRRIKATILRAWLQQVPEVADEIRDEGVELGVEKAVLHQFERKLARVFSEAEHTELARRLRTLGSDHLGDVVLDLAAPQLDAWLRDPDAVAAGRDFNVPRR